MPQTRHSRSRRRTAGGGWKGGIPDLCRRQCVCARSGRSHKSRFLPSYRSRFSRRKEAKIQGVIVLARRNPLSPPRLSGPMMKRCAARTSRGPLFQEPPRTTRVASRRKPVKRRPVVIQHAVWVYLRFTLSYRDVEDLLAERGRPMIWAHRMTFIESAGRVVLGFQIWSRNVGPS